MAGNEVLVRQDGAHGEHPTGTLLPWAKAGGIKLSKEHDPPNDRDFTFVLTREREGELVVPGHDSATFAPPTAVGSASVA